MHVLEVHTSETPEELAWRKQQREAEAAREKERRAQRQREAQLLIRRHQLVNADLQRVLAFQPPQPTPEELAAMKLAERQRPAKALAEAVERMESEEEREAFLAQRRRFLRQHHRCIHVRGYKGDRALEPLQALLGALGAELPDLRLDVEAVPAPLWKLRVLPELLAQRLPSAAMHHAEGPLIWAACEDPEAVIETDTLYLPTIDDVRSYYQTDSNN